MSTLILVLVYISTYDILLFHCSVYPT